MKKILVIESLTLGPVYRHSYFSPSMLGLACHRMAGLESLFGESTYPWSCIREGVYIFFVRVVFLPPYPNWTFTFLGENCASPHREWGEHL